MNPFTLLYQFFGFFGHIISGLSKGGKAFDKIMDVPEMAAEKTSNQFKLDHLQTNLDLQTKLANLQSKLDAEQPTQPTQPTEAAQAATPV